MSLISACNEKKFQPSNHLKKDSQWLVSMANGTTTTVIRSEAERDTGNLAPTGVGETQSWTA